MTLGLMASQAVTKAMPKEAIAHKWHVFQHIREARELIGATDRSLAILNALLSFHPETALHGDDELIVWPSNEQLMSRANGMPATTLRRHLAVLVDCGLIIRRDSPNGKRFARKGRGGEIEQAYGFDLSPLVARAEEFRDLAEAVQADKKAFRAAKERLTLLRRDIVKMIDTAIAENIPGPWERMTASYEETMARIPRTAPRQYVETVCEDLYVLWTEVREALETFAKTQNMNANESHSGRHIQNSNPDSILESEQDFREDDEASRAVESADNVRSLPQRELPLALVIDACPSIVEMAPNRTIRHWRDLVAAADKARPMLQISPSAWKDAREAMGDKVASVTLAAILERSDQIKSAGGYLRSLVERAKAGKFSTWPMIMALIRAKLDHEKARLGATDSSATAMVASPFENATRLGRSDQPKHWD